MLEKHATFLLINRNRPVNIYLVSHLHRCRCLARE